VNGRGLISRGRFPRLQAGLGLSLWVRTSWTFVDSLAAVLLGGTELGFRTPPGNELSFEFNFGLEFVRACVFRMLRRRRQESMTSSASVGVRLTARNTGGAVKKIKTFVRFMEKIAKK